MYSFFFLKGEDDEGYDDDYEDDEVCTCVCRDSTSRYYPIMACAGETGAHGNRLIGCCGMV